ncbi:unnamed protein product [Calypogeia fissa]
MKLTQTLKLDEGKGKGEVDVTIHVSYYTWDSLEDQDSDIVETPFVVQLDQGEDGPKIQDALYEVVNRHIVPQVFIDGEHIGGSHDTMEVPREVHQNGTPEDPLGIKVVWSCATMMSCKLNNLCSS